LWSGLIPAPLLHKGCDKLATKSTNKEFLNTYLSKLIEKYNCEIIQIHRLTDNCALDDEVIALAVDKAIKSICKYTGWTEFDINYHSALITLAITYLNNDRATYSSTKGERITKSVTQGARAESYDTPFIPLDSNGLTDQVKAMLPYPKLKVI
jgi:hypothetical protein